MYTLIKEKFNVIDHVKKTNNKSPPNHLQAILDGFSMFNWPMFTDENSLTDMITEYHANVAFYGNKVLKLKQEKDEAWVNAYFDLCLEFKNFAVKNATGLWCWNAKG